MLGGFFSWATPVVLGALSMLIGWVGLEFVGKPVRAFFDIKKDCLEILTLYGNVGPRGVYLHDDHLQPVNAQIVAKEHRLKEAEDAFRKCGSKLQAFANTERLAVIALRRLGYQPLDAGRGFVGLSNSIGEHGQTRSENRKLIERSLKAMM
jgi:hypothetical protein